MAKLDLVDFTKKYKAETYGFFLDFDNWRTFTMTRPLTWEKVRFTAAERSSVPRARGVYAFSVELSPSFLPAHGYILYVGITGDKSASHLQKRFGEYLTEQVSEDKRPAVRYMLRNWRKDLFFNFAPLPDRRFSLLKLERQLLSAVIPPVNQMDFSAEIKAARRAAF